MKTIVIYHSQTGFTKQYAEWIAEKSDADCCELREAKRKKLECYDAVVFGSWACAGGISKINWFKENIQNWEGKKLIVFCVGASPIENPEVQTALERNFTPEERKKVNAFYCPGGFRYEKMSTGSRLMMKMFSAALKAKKNKTEEEEIMSKMIASSYDISDIKYIEPIVQCLNAD